MDQVPFYRQRLRHELAARLQRNDRYSLRAFAKALRIEPSALSQILAGKRLISEKMARRFFSVLDLSTEEQDRFIHSIAETKQALGLQRISPTLRMALLRSPPAGSTSSSTRVTRDLNPDFFQVIAEWYHYAIIELTETQTFSSDPHWIASQLGIQVTEAKMAFDRLVELELLESQNGRWRKTHLNIDTLDKSTTTAAHRRRQKQILEKSIESLENHPIEARNHSGITVAINPEKIPEAKKRIQTFLWELAEWMAAEDSQKVYELNIQLIPLQKLENPSQKDLPQKKENSHETQKHQ